VKPVIKTFASLDVTLKVLSGFIWQPKVIEEL